MSRTVVAACAALSVASLGAAIYAVMESHELRAEVAALRARPPAAAPAYRGRTASEEEAFRKERDALAESGEGVGVEGAVPGAGTPSESGSPPLKEVAAEKGPLRDLVKTLLREELDARAAAEKEAGGGKEKGEKRPPLSQFAAELELVPAQKEGVRLAVLKGQEEMIALLRTPTAGGRVPVDDLMDALLGKPEEAQTKMIEVFAMLTSETVPGSADTYGARLEEMKARAVEAFKRDFTPDQFKAFEKMGQDPLEIEVPGSPWITVLQEAWARRSK